MTDAVKRQYAALRADWDNGLAGELKRSAIAFLILYLLAFGLCAALPDLRNSLVSRAVSTIESMAVTDENGALSALALFSNNLRACGVIMLYGLIPFILLPALSLGVNAMLLGVLGSWYLAEGISMTAYFAALIPHGIFELPALISAFAVGLYACGQTTGLVRRQEGCRSVWECVILISRVLTLIQLPLLAVSALVEAYVTPVIASFFL